MDMQFLDYTYKSFKPEDLIPEENEVLSLGELRRIDCFNFCNCKMPGQDVLDFIKVLYDKYAEDFEKDDWKERDFIFFRCIFKEFVVRMPVDDYKMFVRFKIIDNDPENIINEKVLLSQMYQISKENETRLLISFRIKLTHKDLVYNNIHNTVIHYRSVSNDWSWLKDINMYVLPVYLYSKYSTADGKINSSYERISTIKNRSEYKYLQGEK